VTRRGDTFVIGGIIDVSRESQLWGDQYSEKLQPSCIRKNLEGDLRQLRIQLSGQEQDDWQRDTKMARPTSLSRGRYYWNKRTNEA